MTRFERDALVEAKHQERHGMFLTSGRVILKRDILQCVGKGWLRELDELVVMCDGDGWHREPDRYRVGYALTDAGREALSLASTPTLRPELPAREIANSDETNPGAESPAGCGPSKGGE